MRISVRERAHGTYSKLLNVSLGVPWHTDYDSGVIKRRDHLGIISVGYIMVIWFDAPGIIDVLSGCLGTTADLWSRLFQCCPLYKYGYI